MSKAKKLIVILSALFLLIVVGLQSAGQLPALAECSSSNTTGCNTPTPTPTPPSPQQECINHGFTWNGTTCITTNSSGSGSSATSQTGTPTPKPATTTNNTGSASGDRLAQVGEATISCIRTILNAAEIERLRFLQPKNADETRELEGIKNRAYVCFQNYKDTVKTSDAGSKISTFPNAQKECLVKQIGEAAFNEINSGKRTPTQSEKQKGDSCFNKGTEPTVAYQTKDAPLSKDIENCLVLALGTKRYSEVNKQIGLLTLSERESTAKCFGAGTHPLQKATTYELPEKVNSCLATALGAERAKELESGHLVPTTAEKVAGKKCFENINQVQDRLLPKAPKEIPFLEESATVKVSGDKTEQSDVTPGVKDNSLVLSGKAAANTLVDVYIFSDPIVVSTETDANGDWVYKLSDPLESGSHIAYAVSQDSSGKSVRSSIYNFEALAAAEDQSTLLNENRTSTAPQSFVTYAIVAVALALLVVGIAIFVIRKKLTVKKKSTDTPSDGGASGSSTPATPTGTSGSDGQGETKTTAGPVN